MTSSAPSFDDPVVGARQHPYAWRWGDALFVALDAPIWDPELGRGGYKYGLLAIDIAVDEAFNEVLRPFQHLNPSRTAIAAGTSTTIALVNQRWAFTLQPTAARAFTIWPRPNAMWRPISRVRTQHRPGHLMATVWQSSSPKRVAHNSFW